MRGRPKEANPKDKRITLRFDKKEYDLILKKSEKAGVKVSEFLRDSALNKEIKERPVLEGKEILKIISRMAINLNQITRKLNGGNWTHVFDKKSVIELAETLKNLKSKIE